MILKTSPDVWPFQEKCLSLKPMKDLMLIIALSLVALLSRADNITFADAAVKALCVANWDTDNDGELSTDEAAAVTTLGEVFRGNKEIGTFSELKFFTGLTEIGEYAFSESSISGELRIPGNVKAIRSYAFYNCQQLCRIIVEEGVESIDYLAFSGPVTYLSLPNSIIYLASSFINPYFNGDPGSEMFVPVGDLTVSESATEPPAIHDFAFYYVFGSGHLIVPFGSKDYYRSANGWRNFGEYIEVGDVNHDGKLNVADIARLIAYVTGREYTEIEARIADVNGDGAVDADDVTLLCSYILE